MFYTALILREKGESVKSILNLYPISCFARRIRVESALLGGAGLGLERCARGLNQKGTAYFTVPFQFVLCNVSLPL